MDNFTFVIETTCGDRLYFGGMENLILNDFFPILTKRKIKSVTSNLVEMTKHLELVVGLAQGGFTNFEIKKVEIFKVT